MNHKKELLRGLWVKRPESSEVPTPKTPSPRTQRTLSKPIAISVRDNIAGVSSRFEPAATWPISFSSAVSFFCRRQISVFLGL